MREMHDSVKGKPSQRPQQETRLIRFCVVLGTMEKKKKKKKKSSSLTTYLRQLAANIVRQLKEM